MKNTGELCGPRTDRGYNQTTASGYPFWVLDPRPEDIRIEDIAAHLPRICRFGGALKESVEHFCPSVDSLVLTDDLRWVAAGDLIAGQGLVGFDENSDGERRKLRPSRVISNPIVKRESVRIVLSNGDQLFCAADHPWLAESRVSRNKIWATSHDFSSSLLAGFSPVLPKFIDTWSCEPTREAGWLSGMFDGEGSFSSYGRRGTQVSIAQNPGAVLGRLIDGLSQRGFVFGHRKSTQCAVNHLQIRGGWREHLRLLGVLRPTRLINNFVEQFWAGLFPKILANRSNNCPVVVAVESLGEQWVAAIETSTRTYFCDGYGAHNSVAQHSVLVSRNVPQEFAIEALLHDAAEAYVGDVIKPIKLLLEIDPDTRDTLFMALHSDFGRARSDEILDALPSFSRIEGRVDAAIRAKFGLPLEMSPEVKEADYRAVLTEKRDLLNDKVVVDWGIPDLPPFEELIVPVLPSVARAQFLQRFSELYERENNDR